MLPKISLTHYRHFQGFVSVLCWKTSCRTEKFWGRHSLFFKNCIIKRHFAAESAAENNVNFKSNSPFSVQIPQNSSYVLDSELAGGLINCICWMFTFLFIIISYLNGRYMHVHGENMKSEGVYKCIVKVYCQANVLVWSYDWDSTSYGPFTIQYSLEKLIKETTTLSS